jgi:hypothetical protein
VIATIASIKARPMGVPFSSSSDRARSAPQPDKGRAFVRRLRIRFPGLPHKIKAPALILKRKKEGMERSFHHT